MRLRSTASFTFRFGTENSTIKGAPDVPRSESTHLYFRASGANCTLPPFLKSSAISFREFSRLLLGSLNDMAQCIHKPLFLLRGGVIWAKGCHIHWLLFGRARWQRGRVESINSLELLDVLLYGHGHGRQSRRWRMHIQMESCFFYRIGSGRTKCGNTRLVLLEIGKILEKRFNT